MKIRFTLNGKRQVFDVAANDSLLHLLRARGFESVHHGCETGDCGSCAVLVDGRPVNACLMLAAQAEGRRVETHEQVAEMRILDPVRQALVDCGASQCGFCMPGMLISMKALLEVRTHPDVEEIVEALSGNLCRCTHYVRPVEAIVRAVTGKSMGG